VTIPTPFHGDPVSDDQFLKENKVSRIKASSTRGSKSTPRGQVAFRVAVVIFDLNPELSFGYKNPIELPLFEQRTGKAFAAGEKKDPK
jgi:hypothetical protein